jgi:toxin-antitoxin system PIN domain toxin
MILLDANVLIYAHSASMPQHRAARAWLDGMLNGSAPVGIPWPSMLAFLRILSNPRAVPEPSPIMALWRQVNDWLAVENVWIPAPHERHVQILASLLPLAATHLLIVDAHLAALAIEHNLTLCSTDGDFARLPRSALGKPARGQLNAIPNAANWHRPIS